MIPLPKMSKECEDKYYHAVLCILNRISTFPLAAHPYEKRSQKLDQLFTTLFGVSFRDFILAPYEKLREYKNTLESKGPTGIAKPINDRGDSIELTHSQAYKFQGKNIDFSNLLVKQIFNKFSSDKEYLTGLLQESKLNIWIAKQYDLLVCPYCNINYTYSRKNTIFGAQLDHFFAKGNYPIFAVCLYNLVPSCSTCNNAKRTHESQLSPFDNKVDFNKALQFSYDAENSDFPFSPDSISIRLKYIGDNGKLFQQDMDPTGIKEAYLPFNIYAHRIVLKSYIYNETVINTLLQQYPELFKTKNDVLSLIYGNDFWNKNDIDKIYRSQSLSRLTHDLLVELDVL